MKKIDLDQKIFDTIRDNIKKYRKAKGMTAAELAEAINMSHDYIRKIESERAQQHYSFATIYKISVALDVSLDDLIHK